MRVHTIYLGMKTKEGKQLNSYVVNKTIQAICKRIELGYNLAYKDSFTPKRGNELTAVIECWNFDEPYISTTQLRVETLANELKAIFEQDTVCIITEQKQYAEAKAA